MTKWTTGAVHTSPIANISCIGGLQQKHYYISDTYNYYVEVCLVLNTKRVEQDRPSLYYGRNVTKTIKQNCLNIDWGSVCSCMRINNKAYHNYMKQNYTCTCVHVHSQTPIYSS